MNDNIAYLCSHSFINQVSFVADKVKTRSLVVALAILGSQPLSIPNLAIQ